MSTSARLAARRLNALPLLHAPRTALPNRGTSAVSAAGLMRWRRISSSPELVPPAAPPPAPSQPLDRQSSSTLSSHTTPSTPSTSSRPLPSSTTTQDAIALLRSQPPHYIALFLLGRRYLLHTDDVLTVPRIKDVSPGDILSLTRITEVGSRDYTLRASPSGDRYAASRETKPPPGSGGKTAEESREAIRRTARPRDVIGGLGPAIPETFGEGEVVEAKMVVVEQTRGEWKTIIKKKRRKGYRKTVHGKPAFTRLRLVDITFPSAS